MLLIIRFALILLFIAGILAIPFFLLKLNELEEKKKANKKTAPAVRETAPTAPNRSYMYATPHVSERLLKINEKQKALQTDKKWLSLESSHYVMETFPNDLKNYQEAYLDLKNKKQVEAEVLAVLDNMIDDLVTFEKEIEEKKKTVLDRQGYIIENREKNHL